MLNPKEKLQQDFPFISVLTYGKNEYVGIIINQDQNVTSIYDYDMIKLQEHKQVFLELGDVWWWESNRLIPINIFLRGDMERFSYAIKNFTTKDVKVLFGHVVNLNNIIIKRVKRKSVHLIRHR
jgi:hypothetical protein